MKRVLWTVLITSIVMMTLMGVIIWRTSSVSKKLASQQEEKLMEEKDLLSADGEKAYEEIEERKIVPLYLKGIDKNVVTYEKESTTEIYDTVKSAEIKKQLENMQEMGEYSFEKPLIAYNPFGTLNNSLFVYFSDSKKSYIRYTISVEDQQIPDFTRTCLDHDGKTMNKEHEFTLAGLVPGMKNYIIMESYNSHDALENTMVYTLDVPECSSGLSTRITVEKGRSKDIISNGLYEVFGHCWGKGKNRQGSIALYDNSGVLRGEIPLEDDYSGEAILNVYDKLVYGCAKDKIAQVSAAGQVMYIHELKGYSQSGAYVYDECGNLYIAASKNKRQSVNDIVLKVALTEQTVEQVLDLTKIMDAVYDAAKPVKGEKKLNWLDINALALTDVDQLLISSRELSSIIKINHIHSKMPSIGYILADKGIWKASSNRDKVYEKSYKEGEEPQETEPLVESILDTKEKKPEPFASHFGQTQIEVEKSEELGEGQYYLYVLNNNYGEWETRPVFDFDRRYEEVGTKNRDADASYYYRYIVDEAAGTYYLDNSEKLPYIGKQGHIQYMDEEHQILLTVTDKKHFFVMDDEGKVLYNYQLEEEPAQVIKEDFMNFWFQ